MQRLKLRITGVPKALNYTVARTVLRVLFAVSPFAVSVFLVAVSVFLVWSCCGPPFFVVFPVCFVLLLAPVGCVLMHD